MGGCAEAKDSGTAPGDVGGNGENPVVTLEMENGGKIVIELYPDKAPNTVRNYISLVQSGFYDGLGFHRISPGFMIQGGSPNGTSSYQHEYAIKGEFPNNGFTQNDLKHTRGVISMARVGDPYMDSAGVQFFIMHADDPSLDGGYAAFGEVIEGLDIVDRIATGERSGDKALKPEKIKKATVETFGKTYAGPETIKK